jgi:hypothetical protein
MCFIVDILMFCQVNSVVLRCLEIIPENGDLSLKKKGEDVMRSNV